MILTQELIPYPQHPMVSITIAAGAGPERHRPTYHTAPGEESGPGQTCGDI